MASVIEVFNVDGTLQSVSLHGQVRADEVVHAVARRHNISSDQVPFYGLYQVTRWRVRDQVNGTETTRKVELKKLAPEDRPLKVKAMAEVQVKDSIRTQKLAASSQGLRLDISASISFAFLNSEGEALVKERGEDIFTFGRSSSMGNSAGGLGGSGSKTNNNSSGSQNGVNSNSGNGIGKKSGGGVFANYGAYDVPNLGGKGFAPINSLGRGEKCGFLFQRSAANPREWQRRWCILKKDELIHCLSNLDHSDAKYVRLTQNHVKPIVPKDLGGLKHCFEIDTAHDVLQFRAKTEEEANSWIFAIERNIELASENEKFHLAERMIEDGQRSICTRDEMILAKSLTSLEGLLSTHAGADRLFRYAKRSSLGKKSARNAELVAFYLDLGRAFSSFSSLSSASSPTNVVGEQVKGFSSLTHDTSGRSLNNDSFYSINRRSTNSVASSSGSSATCSTLRGSAAALSRKDWMIQICERFISLYEATAETTDYLNMDEVREISRATERLRKELLDETISFIPGESCTVIIEEARKIVLQTIENELYQDFVQSRGYENIIATIPSRIRK